MGKETKENAFFTGEYHYSIFVASISCFDIVSDTGSFFKWMHTVYPQIKDAETLEGYQYFIELLVGMVADSFKNSEDAGLNNHDCMFDRALFHGVAPDKTQPTNDLGKLFVILQKRVEQIKETTAVQKFREEVKRIKQDIISVFNDYRKAHTINESPFNTQEGEIWCMRAFVWVYLVNAQTGVPQAHNFNPLHSDLPGDIIEEGTPKFELLRNHLYEKDTCLCGFCYVLEYLIRKIFPDYLTEDMLFRLHTADDWRAVDLFFTDLHNDFFKEKNETFEHTWYFKIFSADAPISEAVLAPILREYEEPHLSMTEQLEQTFLWYNIGFLDATNTIFTGHAAFSALLDGEVQLSMEETTPSPIQIRIIKHPTEVGNYYSYALLLERHGWLTDNSGWIVCYNCSTDFSGTGGYYNDLIQEKLNEYKSHLEIKECYIEDSKFKRFCLEREVSSREDVIGQQLSELEVLKVAVSKYKHDSREAERKAHILSNKVTAARGMITELLTYYHTSKNTNQMVDWNIKQKSKELDVICSVTDKTSSIPEDKSLIIECKYSDHIDLKEEFRKLADKIETCTIYGKRAEGVFYFYQRLTPKNDALYYDLVDKYRKKEIIIQDYVVLSDLMREGKYKQSIWSEKDLDKIGYLMQE